MKQRRAVGYIRESVEDRDQDPEAQREGQRAAVRALAKANDGVADIDIFDDWDRSGAGDQLHKRKAYAAMVAAIERDEVSVVYARSMDRLYRSVQTFLALQAACRKHGTRIVTQREGAIGGDGSPMADAFATIGATFAQLESDTAKVRARYGVVTKRRNGIPLGRKRYGEEPGESVAAVLDAFREAGSFLGAAKLLNARKVPNRLHSLGRQWNVRTVARIIRRADPNLVPPRGRQGARARSTRLFSGLLKCHCGDYLTSMPRKRKNAKPSIGYYCRRAHQNLNGDHPRPYVVSEKKLLPLVQAEATLIALPSNEAKVATENRERRAALEAKRTQLTKALVMDGIDVSVLQMELASIKAALADLDAEARAITLPTIDWTDDPADLNPLLRTWLTRIDLGPDLLPAPDGFVWAIKRWRKAA
jgi:DNA invertase Pin-like site-specific DNA recombinase